MGAIATAATIYLVISVALGGIWVARDFRLPLDRDVVHEFVVVALEWPLLLVLTVILLLATKSQRHDQRDRAIPSASGH